MPSTLFEKIWGDHLVVPESPNCPATLYIDFHLLNEVTSPQAFGLLESRSLSVASPSKTLATIDHSIPTIAADDLGKRPYVSPEAEHQVAAMQGNSEAQGIRFLGWDNPNRGIVHVVGPELGLTQPGMTIVCGDSHTSTHGAFGALAFGIGTSEVAQVLATQCMLQRAPRTMRVTIEGDLAFGVSAKDLALTVIARLGSSGGNGYVIEYAGTTVQALSMEGRMTLCNMTIECGARAGMIGVDDTTIQWLRDCPEMLDDFESLVPRWLSFRSDEDAQFDLEVHIDGTVIAPMVTWGVTPDTAIAVDDRIPLVGADQARRDALNYMGLDEGQPILGTPIDLVFIGSCTNARLPDLRIAADILRGKRIADQVTLLVVPGSESVRRAAEIEGLDRVFKDAGGQWRLAGCSMCLGMNGDLVPPGKTAISTSNRNFVGRQGPGARTILASPATAAASALRGAVADVREVLNA